MKCPTDIMWSNYVEGESPADQEETLARHLEECPACAARCQELSDMRAVLKDALGDKPRRRLALPAASRWLLPLAAALLICILRLMSMDLTTPNAPPNVPAVPGPGESWSYRKVDSDLGLPVLRLIGRMAIQAPGEAVWRPAVAGERLPWGGRVRVATDSLVELGYRRSRIRLAGGSRMGLTGRRTTGQQ